MPCGFFLLWLWGLYWRQSTRWAKAIPGHFSLFRTFSVSMQKHDYNNLTFPVLHWRVWCPPLPSPPPPTHCLRAPTLTITQVFRLLVLKKDPNLTLHLPFSHPMFMCVTHLIFFQVDLPAYSCAYAVWCWSSQSGVAHKVGLLWVLRVLQEYCDFLERKTNGTPFRGLHLSSILLQCLSVYLFSFLVCHIIVVYIIDSIV